MTDEAGKIIWRGQYSAWGKLTEEEKANPSIHQPFRLQNQYADEETGLHYNFFRYYDAHCGRFTQLDPIGVVASENLYTFAPNPQKWIDILGAMAQVAAGCTIGAPFGGPIGCGAGAIIAAVGTVAVMSIAAIVNSKSPSSTKSTSTTCGTCNQPVPKCPPDVYAKLNNDVHNAKALAGQLGGCKNGMSIYEIKQRMMAWKGLAIARSRREKQCWEGGNSGHGQAITQAWNTYTNCKNLLP